MSEKETTIPGGFYIVLEGPDGSGKSTQARYLANRLGREGYMVVSTKEPGGTVVADRIRALLLDRGAEDMSALAELFLFEASRTQLRTQVIIPSLSAGRVIISDRSEHSSTAYQGYGGKVDLEIVRQLNAIATLGIRPDLEVFIDADPKKGLDREVEKGRFNDKGLIYHEKVRQGFLEIAAQDPIRRHLMHFREGDAEGMAEEVYRIAKAKIDERLKQQ
jgi:dTMP kinase